MTDVAGVVDQMIAAGMPEIPERLEIDGRLHRFGRKKRGWYRLFERVGRTGRAFVTGAFGCWGRVDATKVRPEGLSEDERRELREQAQRERALEEQRRRDAAARAAMRGRERWAAASRTGSSRYLERKKISPESVRFEPTGTILVPMVRYDRPHDSALVGLQAIAPSGEKRFAKGTAKEGAMCRLGAVGQDEHAPMLVCEGYATGRSIRMALDERWPVFVAFDAGNLVPAARLLRQLFPDRWFLFCADNDALSWTAKGGRRHVQNPGKAWAVHACRVAGNADFVTPYVCDATARWTDFNDMHVLAGLAAVRRRLMAAIEAAISVQGRAVHVG